jgi:2-polyprenyl-6-hydroxyphenyl methylase/3-demethylubiquinone-9 3-methyltransferase
VVERIYSNPFAELGTDMLLKDTLTKPQTSNQDLPNISDDEIAKFDALANEWRDPNGKFANVLAFNRARLSYVKQQISAHFGPKKISILDVGCGAGLLTQPLAEMGHSVVGIDASGVNIEVASRHAKGLENLQYRHVLSQSLLQETQRFDLVLNTEVLEHVPDPTKLLQECSQLVSPHGIMILATLNRTWQSYLIGIIGAEYILRALPKGTHDWRAFVKPKEIEHTLSQKGYTLSQAVGMSFNPLSNSWRLTKSDKVNYLLTAYRPS